MKRHAAVGAAARNYLGVWSREPKAPELTPARPHVYQTSFHFPGSLRVLALSELAILACSTTPPAELTIT